MSRRFLFLVAGLLLFSGCAVPLFPTCGGWLQGKRRCIDREMASFISAGETTKDDVIRNLGFPTRVLRNGTVYGYDWGTVSWGIGVPGGGGGSTVEKYHLLLVAFDSRGRVVRHEKRTGYFFPKAEFSGGAIGTAEDPAER